MRKSYSLDFTLERDEDRLKYIQMLLDSIPTKPTQHDLELFANYLLNGKDENGQNSSQRHETQMEHRYNSYRKKDDKIESLDAFLETELGDMNELQVKDAFSRDIYTHPLPVIRRPNKKDCGDADIPGMVELWERIDYLEHVYKVNAKLEEPKPNEIVPLIRDTYRLYQLKHQIIDMRRHQYYLKDSYKPTIRFLSLIPPTPQTVDWNSDSGYWITKEEWEKRVHESLLPRDSDITHWRTRDNAGITEVFWVVDAHTFNWFDPNHIKALLLRYSAVLEQLRENVSSSGRALIYDFDRYFNMCHFPPLYEWILTRFIDGLSCAQISLELHGQVTKDYVYNVVRKHIPEGMARAAWKHYLMRVTPIHEKKWCIDCHTYLPRCKEFFNFNASKRDGFSSFCRECARKRRNKKMEVDKDGRRNKKAYMFTLPNGTAVSKFPEE